MIAALKINTDKFIRILKHETTYFIAQGYDLERLVIGDFLIFNWYVERPFKVTSIEEIPWNTVLNAPLPETDVHSFLDKAGHVSLESYINVVRTFHWTPNEKTYLVEFTGVKD